MWFCPDKFVQAHGSIFAENYSVNANCRDEYNLKLKKKTSADVAKYLGAAPNCNWTLAPSWEKAKAKNCHVNTASKESRASFGIKELRLACLRFNEFRLDLLFDDLSL